MTEAAQPKRQVVTGYAQLGGLHARVVLEESIINQGYINVTLILEPPPGYHREVYNGMVKP